MDRLLNDLKGNPGQRKPATRSFRAATDQPPEWLDKVARQLYRRIAPPLITEGLLNEVTIELVAAGCQAYAVYRGCQDTLKQEGRIITTKTGVRAHPACALEKTAFEQFVRVFKELGVAGTPLQGAKDNFEDFLTILGTNAKAS